MLTQTRLRSALLGSGAAVALLMPSAAATAGEVDGLRDQIQALQDRLDRIEQDQAAIDERAYTIAPAMAVTGGDIEGSFKLPGSDTSMKIGGFLRADFTYDFDTNSDALGSGSFYFSTIPLDGSAAANRNGEFRFTSRQTWIDITTSTPSEYGEITTYVAFNFMTATGSEFTLNGFTPKLTEAYGTIGPLTVGQTVSTFSDYSSYPTTLDWFNVVGETWTYQTLIRYTHDLGNGMVLKLALENPETTAVYTPLIPGGTATLSVSTFFTSGGSPIVGGLTALASTAGGPGITAGGGVTQNMKFQTGLLSINDQGGLDGPDSVPDAVIKLEYDDSWGHLGLGGILRNLEVDSGTGAASDSALGWGIIAGLWAPTFGDDSVNATLIYGEGIGRYVFGGITDALVTSFAPGLIPDIDPVTVWSWHVGYQHWWTDSLASNAIFGWVHTEIDVGDAFGPGAAFNKFDAAFITNENVQSVHANILWYPADPVMIGLEYIFGARDAIDGQYATASRLQMAFWYSF